MGVIPELGERKRSHGGPTGYSRPEKGKYQGVGMGMGRGVKRQEEGNQHSRKVDLKAQRS